MALTVYEQEFLISPAIVDMRMMAKPSTLCDLIQDVATTHANIDGFGRNDLVKRTGAVWMLSRLKYDIKKPLFEHDKITIKTWHRGGVGALWYRDFEFTQNGEIFGTATTAWAAVDAVTHKVILPESIMPEILKADSGEMLGKLKPLKDGQHFYDYRVCYSDIDLNNHLNNVKSVDILTNPLKLQNKPQSFVKSLEVNFLMQSFDEDMLSIFYKETEGEFISMATKDGRPCLVMKTSVEKF